LYLGDCSAVTSGVDYSPGSNDLTHQDNTDLAGCCNLCNQNSACKAFVWVKANGQCWLKSVNTPTASNINVVSGQRGPPTATPDQCVSVNSGFDVSPGFNDLFHQDNMTLGACCEYCNSNTGCKAFVWVKSNGQCWLKTVNIPPVSNINVISGQRTPGSQCTAISPNYDISPGQNDISQQLGTDLDSCCDLCNHNINCKAFVFVPLTGQCFLKSVNLPTTPNNAVISGRRG